VTYLFIALALLLCVIGLIGCIIPGLPGHPLNYAGMWFVQWAFQPFNNMTLLIFGILTVLILVADYVIPIWTAKKYGATRQGIFGSFVGMIIGFMLPPIGIIIGTIAGAIIGDMMAGKNHGQATRSGLATFTGTLMAIGLKLSLAGVMTGIIFVALFKQLF